MAKVDLDRIRQALQAYPSLSVDYYEGVRAVAVTCSAVDALRLPREIAVSPDRTLSLEPSDLIDLCAYATNYSARSALTPDSSLRAVLGLDSSEFTALRADGGAVLFLAPLSLANQLIATNADRRSSGVCVATYARVFRVAVPANCNISAVWSAVQASSHWMPYVLSQYTSPDSKILYVVVGSPLCSLSYRSHPVLLLSGKRLEFELD
jgi:hypothetical protein